MEISCYLAITRSEMEGFSLKNHENIAFMACQFSSCGTGLSNLPDYLPENAMVILNDQMPIYDHDSQRIADEMMELVTSFSCGCVLLDFERPGSAKAQSLCRHLVSHLPCPVGVSEIYGKDLDCPIFLPPAPLTQPPEEYIGPWKGRELWLDIAPDAACISVTAKGSTITSLPDSLPPEDAFVDTNLCCHYQTKITKDRVNFHLWRNLDPFIQKAKDLGITKCIGLYQQLRTHLPLLV